MQVLNDFFLREIESVLYHRANDEDAHACMMWIQLQTIYR